MKIKLGFKMKYKKNPERKQRHLVSVPFIWMMIIPFVILDIFLFIFHNVAFRLYSLPFIERSKYVRIDRHRLNYLSWIDKLNCAYCGYVNGLLNYASAVSAETEKYWCAIKHNEDKNFIPPAHHKDFIKYGDEKAYNKLNKK